MSKWIDNYKESCKKTVEKRIEKVNNELKELRANYHDFPKNQTLRAIQNRERELEELMVLLNPRDLQCEIRGLQEDYEILKKRLCKVYYLAINIDSDMSEKSENNLKRLMWITEDYRTERIEEEDFKARAETGVW